MDQVNKKQADEFRRNLAGTKENHTIENIREKKIYRWYSKISERFQSTRWWCDWTS